MEELQRGMSLGWRPFGLRNAYEIDRVYDRFFREEVERFGLKGVSWKFKNVLLTCADPVRREIWIAAMAGYPSEKEFRKDVRHELWHIKYRGTMWDNELFATLAEFLGDKLINAY